jgi:NTE family protein
VLTRKEVWLSRGDLFDAIRASIAVPMVFTPHLVGGRPLLDGGILNPVPIAPTLRDATDATVAVSLSGAAAAPARRGHRKRKVEVEKKHHYHQRIERFIDQLQERLGLEDADKDDATTLSLTDTALLSLDAMQASIARCMLAAYPPDLLIEIPIDTCAVHEFYRASEVIRVGEECTERALERFLSS